MALTDFSELNTFGLLQMLLDVSYMHFITGQ